MELRIGRRIWIAGVAAMVTASAATIATAGLASGTPSSGQNVEVLAAGHMADRLKLDTKGPADVVTLRVTIDPDGTSGWHSHGGPVVVTVASGTATFYEASRTTCDREVLSTGQVLAEAANAPSHVLVNEGTDALVVYATFFLSDRAAPVIDAPRPPVCDGIG
jgi:quercetin dioxygenase-like cupin family protein